MDYDVFKTKITKPQPATEPEPASPPSAPPPPQESLPRPLSAPRQGPGPGPLIPFMGGGYMEDFDRMCRIPGMRDFEMTYSKTYRWNLMDPLEECVYYHGQPMNYRGMQWLPPPHAAPALPPPPPRRTLGPPPEYGPSGMILAPPHHTYDYPWTPPTFGLPYSGGCSGCYDDRHPEDCRVM